MGTMLYKLRNRVNNQDVIDRFGSLYYEFKMDKGYPSQLFYLVYILRRLQFILTQTLLFEYVYLQFTLNLIFSVLQFIYVIYFRPFKEKNIMISELIGELCVIFVIILSGFMLPSIDKNSWPGLDQTFIYSIMACIFAQSALGMFSFYMLFKEIIHKYRNSKIKQEDKKLQKVFPENSFTTIADLGFLNLNNSKLSVGSAANESINPQVDN